MLNNTLTKGSHKVIWYPHKQGLSSGVYFFRVIFTSSDKQEPVQTQIKKILFVKSGLTNLGYQSNRESIGYLESQLTTRDGLADQLDMFKLKEAYLKLIKQKQMSFEQITRRTGRLYPIIAREILKDLQQDLLAQNTKNTESAVVSSVVDDRTAQGSIVTSSPVGEDKNIEEFAYKVVEIDHTISRGEFEKAWQLLKKANNIITDRETDRVMNKVNREFILERMLSLFLAWYKSQESESFKDAIREIFTAAQ